MWMTKKATPSKVIEVRRKKAILSKAWESFAIKVLFFIAIFVIIFTFLIGLKRVNGTEMHPTLKDGDYVLYLRHTISSYTNGDVLVYEADKTNKVGRVQATPNDIVGESGKNLTINDNIIPIQKDKGLYYSTKAGSKLKYPITIKKDSFFILGDNRSKETDSREYGEINKKQIKGKVFLVIRTRTV